MLSLWTLDIGVDSRHVFLCPKCFAGHSLHLFGQAVQDVGNGGVPNLLTVGI